MDEADKDAYIIELEKCKLIRLCIIDKMNENRNNNPSYYSLDELDHLVEIILGKSKYTYLQLVEEFKKLL
jgi:hypothetical protein